MPDFIIAGAARSGTTWLCHLLARHPSVGIARPIAPEPKFFLVDDLYARGLGYYAERWFAPLTQPVCGEKSTNYLESMVAAERIAAALPDVRLVFMLRDPVERAFSNFRWSRQNGHEIEDFATAIALDGRRPMTGPLRHARPYDYLSRGRYAALLRPYLERFGRDRVLLVSFEQVVAQAQVAAVLIHRFLGVAERPEDALGLAAINQAEHGDMPAAVRAWLADYYAEPNRDLARLTGFDVSGWSVPRGAMAGASP